MACMDKNYVELKVGDSVQPTSFGVNVGSPVTVMEIGHMMIKDTTEKVWRAKECIKQ